MTAEELGLILYEKLDYVCDADLTRRDCNLIAEFVLKAIEREAKCTIPVVSGSLPLASDEEIQKYVTERFSESHLLPGIIAFRAIKYYQQGMPPVSGRRCCLDESDGKQ